MILIRALAFLLHFTIVPVAMGRLITYKVKDPQHKSALETYVVGLFGALGLFFILCSIITWWQNYSLVHEAVVGGFLYLSISYTVAVIIACVSWIVLDRKNIKHFMAGLVEKKNDLLTKLKADKFLGLYILGFVILLLAQLYFAYGYEVNEWSYDDFDYVANSNDDIAFNMLANSSVVTGVHPVTEPKRVATSWPAYIAYLSLVSGFEVTTVCHTILPVLLLLVAYWIYYYMSKAMFDSLDNRFIFMIILSTLFVFGLFSHYSLTFRLLCTLWQGKAVLCAMVLPFLFAYLPKVLKDEIDPWNMLPIFAISLGASSLSTMSMLLLSLTFGLMFVTMSIYNRKVYGVRYAIAGIMGPVCQLGFYQLVTMLLIEQQSWGKIWFGSNL